MPAKNVVRYALYISGFALSDSADGEQSSIAWNEVDVGKFLRVHVSANVPADVTTLQGRYRESPGDGSTTTEHDLGIGTVSAGGYFEFTLTHHVLNPQTTYLMRVADDFAAPKCMASHSIQTKS
jgi:hypothetical protein